MTEFINYPPSLQKLIRELSRLPSIGQKSASRLAYHLVQNEPELIDDLRDALANAKSSIKQCDGCFFLSETTTCSICTSQNRNREIICVVEKPIDVISIERSGQYNGLYHVLHGLWAPLRGMGPESMKLKELLDRVGEGVVREVVLGLSATVEGEATSLYVARQLKESGVISTRLAQGLPKGGELEFADEITLGAAFSGRKAVNF